MDFVHIINQLVDGLNWAAKNVPWDALAASGLLSGLLVGPYKKIKKWFDHHEVVIIGLIGILGPLVTMVWSYLLHNYGTDPRIVLLQGLGVAFMTQPFYLILVKPGTKRLGAWITAQVLAAQKLNIERSEGLTEPTTGVSVPTTSTVTVQSPSVPIQDFKS